VGIKPIPTTAKSMVFFAYSMSTTFHHGEGEIADEQGGLGRLQALLNGRPAHKTALALKNSLD
jgi:hypothetical protein